MLIVVVPDSRTPGVWSFVTFPYFYCSVATVVVSDILPVHGLQAHHYQEEMGCKFPQENHFSFSLPQSASFQEDDEGTTQELCGSVSKTDFSYMYIVGYQSRSFFIEPLLTRFCAATLWLVSGPGLADWLLHQICCGYDVGAGRRVAHAQVLLDHEVKWCRTACCLRTNCDLIQLREFAANFQKIRLSKSFCWFHSGAFSSENKGQSCSAPT